jgi:hypothetical protein
MCDNSNLYNTLTRFGDYYSLKIKQNKCNEIINSLNENFDWVQYNPRKNIDREGLSITSLDGGLSGRPDLDSLYDYYKTTGIVVKEKDFNIKTIVYDYFKQSLDPIKEFLGRTHVIRLNSGGFFPPHRDNKHSNIESFRLFLPLNYNTQQHYFLLENNKLEFNNGVMYFIDTAKMHTVFNTSTKPFYFVVVNVILNNNSIDKTLEFLYG